MIGQDTIFVFPIFKLSQSVQVVVSFAIAMPKTLGLA